MGFVGLLIEFYRATAFPEIMVTRSILLKSGFESPQWEKKNLEKKKFSGL